MLPAHGLPRRLFEARSFADHGPAAAAGFAVALAKLLRMQIDRSTELPIGVGVPVGVDEGVTIWLPREVDLHPVLLGQRQVVEQTAKGERGRRMRLRHLLLVEALRLREQRLALNLQVLLEQLQLGTVALRLGWHTLSLGSAQVVEHATSSHYAERDPAPPGRFRARLKEQADRLLMFPGAGAILFESYRRVLLRRFAYMVVCLVSGERIDVLALVIFDAIRRGLRRPSLNP